MSIDFKSILVSVVILVSIVGIHLLLNQLSGVTTETEHWKNIAIETMYEVGFWRNADKNSAIVIQGMVNELESLNNDNVNSILFRYKNKN